MAFDRKAHSAEYRRINRDRISKQQKEYREQNPEQYKHSRQLNYKRHKGRRLVNAKDRRLRMTPEEKLQERGKAYQKKYGITLEDYQTIFVKQNGECAICNKTGTRPLVVDHNHDTGAMRELLCNNCNSAIGFIYEDLMILENIKHYLTKHNLD